MARKSKAITQPDTESQGVDLVEVERLLAFMQKHGLAEFEYERRGVHIRLKKQAPSVAAPVAFPQPASVAAHMPVSAAPTVAAPAPTPITEDLHTVKSPIVGTFYAAPAPEADPFVVVGSRVQRGQVLCIIEAMKLMNEIESDVAGEVVRIFVENANPVEYGEALFGIKPDGK